jgi:CBS domain-containing protein
MISENGLGIVTDHDFRARVGSGDVGVHAPVRLIATQPVLTVDPDTSVATALLTMIEYGVHHLVVVDDGSRPVGVLRVVDLASSELRDPLVVRAAVERAGSVPELAEACRLLPPTSVELYDTGVPAARIGAVLAAVLDAVMRRLVDITDVDTDLARIRRSWLVLGSLARREPLPTSDVDTALVWQAGDATGDDDPGERLRTAAARVLDHMESCGLPRCPDGANADNPRFNRSLEEWTTAAGTWIKDLSGDGALLLVTMLADSRPINEVALGRSTAERMLRATGTPQFRRALLTYTLSGRPPTGFVRGFVVEHSGEHRGQLSLKRGGLRPITSLGRWVAVTTADPHGSTVERLRRGARAGLFTQDESESLIGAFEHLYAMLMEQEVEALRVGRTPSTYVNPAELDSLTRRHLRESFRAIAHVQDRLGSHWQARWG